MHFPDSENSNNLLETSSGFLIEGASGHEGALEVTKNVVNEIETGLTDDSFADAPFLIFQSGAAVFGVPALAVRTIHALPALSPLQETASFIVGVFNLRGAIVPVMDLNARFGLRAQPYRLDDSLVVLSWNGAEVAIIVNEVRAVKRIFQEQIEDTPAHGRRHDLPTPFLAGVAQIDDDIVMLLDLAHLLEWHAAEIPPIPVEQLAAHRLEAQEWTKGELAILEARAAQLRFSSNGQSQDNEDSQDTIERSPVAIIAVGGEEFGVELGAVREFASISAVAPVPCCPPHILGQINLRGDIVTLVDVRQTLRTARTTPKFFESNQSLSTQMNPQTDAKPRPVVVVEYESAPVGIVVDELQGVLYLHEDERRTLDTSAQSGDNGKYFSGGALHEGRLLPLLDITKLFDEGGLTVEESV